MAKPIVVVGSINMDLVSHGPDLPLPGQTVRGTRFDTFAGGKGANQAVGVASLGYPVAMIGRVGDDAFGHQLLQSLKNNLVDVSRVLQVAGSSGVAAISTDTQARNSIMVIPGANDRLLPADMEEASDFLATAGMVLAQLEIPIETVSKLAEICQRHGVPLMLDPAPMQQLSPSLLKQVTWLTPNETEASGLLPNLSSEDSLEGKLQALIALGVENGILKLGGGGAALATRRGAYLHLPAFPVVPVDTTAAGDCFNAAFAVATMRGENPFATMRFASAAAAISVTRTGAQRSMPTSDEVTEFLKTHPEYHP